MAKSNKIEKLIEYINEFFLQGEEYVQAHNLKFLIKFMSNNGMSFKMSQEELDELLKNYKLKTCLSKIISSKNNKLYLCNRFVYSLALRYAENKGIKLVITEEEKKEEPVVEQANENEQSKYYIEDDELYLDTYLEEDPLKMYLRDFSTTPYTRDEEIEVFTRYQNGEKELKDEIIKHYLSYVVKFAKSYIGRGVDYLDLIQEGNIGLQIAVDRFDLKEDCTFLTYATWYIRLYITRCLSNDSRTIRIPVYLAEVMPRVYEYVRKYRMYHNGDYPSMEEISRETGVNLSWVRRVLAPIKTVSLDEPIMSSEGEEETTLADFIADENTIDPEEKRFYEQFRNTVFESGILTKREVKELKLRYGFVDGHDRTLEEVGRDFNVTRARVEQIERNAMKKLRRNYKVRSFKNHGE